MLDDDGSREADWSARVEDPALQSELRKALTAAIAALPIDYRAVIVLRDVEGLSTREVADTLGLTIVNVKTRTHRARLFLRSRLGRFMAHEAA